MKKLILTIILSLFFVSPAFGWYQTGPWDTSIWGDLTLTDGTDSHIIKAVQEPGLGGRATIGLDETARTMVICDAGDVDVDFGLTIKAHPTLWFFDDDHSDFGSISQAGNAFTFSTTTGAANMLFYASAGYYFSLTSDRAAGNAFTVNSGAGNELTDTNGEQSWVYIEPKVNQTGTAAYNGLKILVTETAKGDGSTGTGATNNLIVAGPTTDPDVFKVDNAGAVTAGAVSFHSIKTTLSTAQVNALRGSPITLVAAQGANTWIEFVSAVIAYDYATAAFTVAAGEDLVIEWADGTDATASIETTGFLDQVDDEIRFYPCALAAGADIEASINQGLRIFNTGAGEIADGGGEVDVTVTYRVHTTGF